MSERIVSSHLIEITPRGAENLPEKLRNENGEAVDRHLDHRKYTTPEILAQEDKVLAAVVEPVPVFAESAAINKAVAAFEKDNGFSLKAGQVELARHLLLSGTMAACGVGSAGTGKTTSMQIVARVWTDHGHNVIGCAPSAAAASVLSEELGIDANTIDSLTFTWRGRNPNKPTGDLSALPVQINQGDMLLVDESGMATTDNLVALVEIAGAAGAIVRFVGDPHQLDAVGTGGLYATMCRYNNAAELTDVMRFSHGNDTEQADASLGVRRGDTAAAEFYFDRGWVTADGARVNIEDALKSQLADTGWALQTALDADGVAQVVSVSKITDTRYSTGEHRMIAQLETLVCAWPGCSRSAGVCQMHHIHGHARGGPTSWANLTPLCSVHNGSVHNGMNDDDPRRQRHGRIKRGNGGYPGLEYRRGDPLRYSSNPLFTAGWRGATYDYYRRN